MATTIPGGSFDTFRWADLASKPTSLCLWVWLVDTFSYAYAKLRVPVLSRSMGSHNQSSWTVKSQEGCKDKYLVSQIHSYIHNLCYALHHAPMIYKPKPDKHLHDKT